MCKIKAIGFDIGGTLVNYNKPLNWSALYEDAINYMCNQDYTIKDLTQIIEIIKNNNY